MYILRRLYAWIVCAMPLLVRASHSHQRPIKRHIDASAPFAFHFADVGVHDIVTGRQRVMLQGENFMAIKWTKIEMHHHFDFLRRLFDFVKRNHHHRCQLVFSINFFSLHGHFIGFDTNMMHFEFIFMESILFYLYHGFSVLRNGGPSLIPTCNKTDMRHMWHW